jgi:hypothetical protein
VLFLVGVWSVEIILSHLHNVLTTVHGGPSIGVRLIGLGLLVIIGVFFIADALRFAHKIVGPLYRIRKTIEAVVAGEQVELIHLRKGDFLVELKDEINEMLKILEQRGAITLKPGKASAQAPAEAPAPIPGPATV